MHKFPIVTFFLSGLLVLCYSFSAKAQIYQERIKRITVFPIKVIGPIEKEVEKSLDDAWWEVREKLAESKRFLVASKNFMQAKDVFQPRGDLQATDVLILGRFLDADALLTLQLKDRRLSLYAYETKNGFTLWSDHIDLHPAVPVSKQISGSTQKLLFDLMSAIPYQGHVIVDNLIGRPQYTDGGKQLFKMDIGEANQIAIGDSAEVVNIHAEKIAPLFQGGANIEVFAEGRVIKVERNIATVQLVRIQDKMEIKSDDLVRVPDEIRRLKEVYGIHEDLDKNIDFDSIDRADVLKQQKVKEIKPLVNSLSWIGNFVLILLLAF